MATLLDLKMRVAAELNRDDLEDDLSSVLATHINQACEYYADRRFWFNAIVTTMPTVANTATAAIPATVRRIDRLTIPSLGVELVETVLEDVDCPTSQTGQPRRYSYYNDTVRLFPVPGGVYTLQIYGVAQIAAPATDAASNIWTTEAYDLITAQVKMTLCRGVLRDPDGAQLAIAEVQDSLARLERETATRLVTPLRMPDGFPLGYTNAARDLLH